MVKAGIQVMRMHWWHALVTVHCDGKLVLNMEHAIQTTEGDSVATPINTNQLSLEDSSHWAVNTTNNSERTRTTAGDDDWEHLNISMV